MANHVVVGCSGLPRGIAWPHYFQRLPYLELTALHTGPVRPSLLTKWRASTKHAGSFGVVAPALITHSPGPRGYGERGWEVPPARRHEVGGFRASAMVNDAVTSLLDCATALAAGAVIFRSPPDFSPSQANRDAMKRFFSEIATSDRFGDCVRVWHPSGLWDPPVAHACARELGVICALDPLGADPEKAFAPFWAELDDDDGYFVISGLGRSRRRTSDDLLEELADQTARCRRAWVVFATTEPFPDALRFSRIVGRHAGDPPSEELDELEPSDDSELADD